MNKMVKFIIAVVLCASSITVSKLWAQDQSARANEENKSIVVEINYGDIRQDRKVEVSREKDRSVLEILQTAATVETHPVGQHVFVTSIDGVEGKRGEMAWYYTIDGKSAEKLAYSNIPDSNAGCIKWIYKKDVCSEKADKKI